MGRCLNCMKLFDEKYVVCPHCGYVDHGQAKEAYQLKPGVVLAGRYKIGTAVGVGGFGITYRAWDMTLDCMVAVKEYYPSANGLVNRSPGEKNVIVYSGNRELAFEEGKKRFLLEARVTARFNTHPYIVHVTDFFEENRTAYMVMEFLNGTSYKDYLRSQGGKVSEEFALKVTNELLDALKDLHASGIIHRDISPDNIFISPDGTIKLFDFGAARFTRGEETSEYTVILKPGYAPPEQYQKRSRQGPWTDIYAVGAMLYRALVGFKPDESTNRVEKDNVVPPHDVDNGISENLSNTIMRSMALNQELRFQNVTQFKEALDGKRKNVRNVEEELKHRKQFRLLIAGIAAVAVTAAFGVCFMVYHAIMANVRLDDADLVVWYPDYGETYKLDGDELETMCTVFRETYPNVEIELVAKPADTYETELRAALEKGDGVPDVFDSTCLHADDYSYLEPLSDTWNWMKAQKDADRYYFIDRYNSYFPSMKQFPMSLQIPVVYKNLMMDVVNGEDVSESATMLDKRALDGIIESKDYAVNLADEAAYRELQPNLQVNGGFEDFFVAPPEESENSRMTDEEIRALIEGKVQYYLSDSGEYPMIQERMNGVYQMLRLDGMVLHGHFDNLWSVSANASGADKKAGQRLIYYLISRDNQKLMHLENGCGIPLQKEIFAEYESLNQELTGISGDVKMLDIAGE